MANHAKHKKRLEAKRDERKAKRAATKTASEGKSTTKKPAKQG